MSLQKFSHLQKFKQRKRVGLVDCQFLRKIRNWEIKLTPVDYMIEETKNPDWYRYKRIDET